MHTKIKKALDFSKLSPYTSQQSSHTSSSYSKINHNQDKKSVKRPN